MDVRSVRVRQSGEFNIPVPAQSGTCGIYGFARALAQHPVLPIVRTGARERGRSLECALPSAHLERMVRNSVTWKSACQHEFVSFQPRTGFLAHRTLRCHHRHHPTGLGNVRKLWQKYTSIGMSTDPAVTA